jgi:hypothetical protein
MSRIPGFTADLSLWELGKRYRQHVTYDSSPADRIEAADSCCAPCGKDLCCEPCPPEPGGGGDISRYRPIRFRVTR